MSKQNLLLDTPPIAAGAIAVAGTGVQGSSGDGGPATAAQLNDPSDVAVTSDGTVYVLEAATNNIRRVNPTTGVIDTVFVGKPNLLKNGEASEGPVGATTPQWVQSGIWKTAVDDACTGCGPDGDPYFTPNGSSGYIEQEIDVSGSATAIDARQIMYSVSGLVGGASGQPRGSTTYVNATGAAIGTGSISLSRSTSIWDSFDSPHIPPVGTRRIRVRLYADPPSGSTLSTIRYDKLMVREMSVSTTTLHRPAALAALGGKLYAVEFHTGTMYQITPGATTRILSGPASGNVLGIGVRSLAAFDDYTLGGTPPAFVWTEAGGVASGSKWGTTRGYYYGSGLGPDVSGAARGISVAIANGYSYVTVTTVAGRIVQRVYTIASPPVRIPT